MNRKKKIKFTVLLAALLLTSSYFAKVMAESKQEDKVKEEKTTSRLIEELKSDKVSVRICAVKELGEREDKSAVPYLIESLGDRELTVKWQACWALGKIKDKSAVPALIERTRDKKENWTVKKKAAESLIDIGTPETFNALVILLKDECETKRGCLDTSTKDSYVSPDEYLERTFSELLRKFVEEAKEKELYISSLAEYKNDKTIDRNFRYRVSIILGQLHQKNTVPILIECLKESERGELRALSAGLLGKLGDKKTVPYLKQALEDNYLDLGYKVSKDVGEEMIKGGQMADGKEIFSAMKIEKEGDYYIVRSYSVRNNAAASLRDLGLKVVRKNNTYIIAE